MGKHTPGPWIISNTDRVTIKDNSGHTSDASDIAYINDEKENWGDYYDGDWTANARLIAAAPELLEALKAMYMTFVIERETLGPAETLALAAIAKAEGE